MSEGRAQFVGDAVAAIIADPLDQAKDAAEKLNIDWEELPAVTETRVATQEGMPNVYSEASNNICFVEDVGDRVAVDRALADAPLQIALTCILAAPLRGRWQT